MIPLFAFPPTNLARCTSINVKHREGHRDVFSMFLPNRVAERVSKMMDKGLYLVCNPGMEDEPTMTAPVEMFVASHKDLSKPIGGLVWKQEGPMKASERIDHTAELIEQINFDTIEDCPEDDLPHLYQACLWVQMMGGLGFVSVHIPLYSRGVVKAIMEDSLNGKMLIAAIGTEGDDSNVIDQINLCLVPEGKYSSELMREELHEDVKLISKTACNAGGSLEDYFDKLADDICLFYGDKITS